MKPIESLDSPIERRSDYYRHKALQIHHKPLPQPLMTIPNILTFIRLLLVPVLIIGWETKYKHSPLFCAMCFVVASITDCFDGYLARRLKAVTVFGAFLDPVADKIMVATALVLLSVSPPAPLTPGLAAAPAILIICREITMSSLREWAAAAGGNASKAVKVNTLGKWKTAIQMVAMSILLILRQSARDLEILVHYHNDPLNSKNDKADTDALSNAPMPLWASNTVRISFVLLWIGTLLGLWSLSIYMSNVWHHFIYPELKPAVEVIEAKGPTALKMVPEETEGEEEPKGESDGEKKGKKKQ
eukprot:CAMPEP_0175082522 /NCGR_PEP_ID=MMETSP0052_2-20121109/26808_1 /TAXON_ID=51329 ORGANISM="Polytomella parva, Strain SAG 63-3" /NCGR_SAMPLE_ID=MMETSP0052_2 /ASSEMBLY_ACC=CAM_ASM_000194 /LENGTH=301 /DNA_ID=CAMNT_0016353739 /DNA_START=102 /DNA_END=1007 /DNA_ORIENTATION=+